MRGTHLVISSINRERSVSSLISPKTKFNNCFHVQRGFFFFFLLWFFDRSKCTTCWIQNYSKCILIPKIRLGAFLINSDQIFYHAKINGSSLAHQRGYLENLPIYLVLNRKFLIGCPKNTAHIPFLSEQGKLLACSLHKALDRLSSFKRGPWADL